MPNIVLPREEFIEAVGWVARTLPAKPYTPILGGVRITADSEKQTVELAAYDTEVSGQITVEDAEVLESGQFVVSGRLLAAISRALPKQAVALKRNAGTYAVLICGKTEFTLPTMSEQEFPGLPILPQDTGRIDAEELAGAIGRVLPAVHHDEALPFLCAVLLEVTTLDTLTLFATDKHRVASAEVPWTALGDTGSQVPIGKTLLVPSRSVGEMGRLSGEDVFLGFDVDKSGILGIHGGARRTTTRLLDHPFPDCRAIRPKEHKALAAVSVEDVAAAMSRALLLDDQDFPRVRLGFGPPGLDIEGGKEGVGGVRDNVDLLHYWGDPIDIEVNPRWLMDALNAVPGDKAAIGINGPKKPLAVAAFDGPPPAMPCPGLRGRYLHLVMPVQAI